MLITNTDLPVLTVSELGRAYEDLRDRLADYDGLYGDRLHARLQLILDELHVRALAASPVLIEQQIGEDRAQAEIAAHTFECSRPVHKVLGGDIEVWSWFESTRFVHVIARDGRWFLRNEPR